MEYPKLSILTPTYDRPNFISLACLNITLMDYDKNKLTWEILDDHPTNPYMDEPTLKRVREILHPIKVKYTYDPKRHMTIGEKRNRLIKMSDNNTFAFLDDDDIYMVSYLKHSIDTMREQKVKIVGSPEMLFVFPFNNFQMSHIRCPAVRQCHEASLVSTRKYVKSMGWFPKSSQGEGAKMFDFNEKQAAKTDITKVMCCVSHTKNTISKEKFLQNILPEGRIPDAYKKLLCEILDIKIGQNNLN